MSVSSIKTYFKNNIAELKTPKLSLGTDILIGSSGSQSSISDSIENKTKSVGKINKSYHVARDTHSKKGNMTGALLVAFYFTYLSMSQISFCKYLNPVKALLSSNFRPNLNLQLPKLSFTYTKQTGRDRFRN
jgi:hypothetical protein